MNNPGGYMFGGMSTILLIFLFVLAVLWFILPFAIFGTKGKLDELIAETKKTNQQLEILIGSINDKDKSNVIERSNTQPIKDEDSNLNTETYSNVIEGTNAQSIKDEDSDLNTETDRAKVLVNTLDIKKKDFSKNFKSCEICQRTKTGLIIDSKYICDACKTEYFK
jgi:hypothetical protein